MNEPEGAQIKGSRSPSTRDGSSEKKDGSSLKSTVKNATERKDYLELKRIDM